MTSPLQPSLSSQMVGLMRSLREAHFARTKTAIDPNIPVIYFEETNFRGKPFDVPLVILRTRPCRWFASGGCVMCNYELMAIDEGVADECVANQVRYAIDRLAPLSALPYMLLTSQGSFFDDQEVPPAVRLEIAGALRKAGLRRLSTESECKYCVNTTAIVEFKNMFDGDISIGLGFEAFDQFVRNVIINKGLTNSVFELAAQRLRSADVAFYTYVTVGKPFMSVEEDIQDATSAVIYCIEQGAFMCVLEMVNIQPYTLTSLL